MSQNRITKQSDFASEPTTRRGFVALAAAAAASSHVSAAPDANEIFHVAIFRFPKEHVNDAIAAFRALASASRRESGCLRYDIYRGIDDDQEFYVVEDWASHEALDAHGRTRGIHPLRPERAREKRDTSRYGDSACI